MPAILLPRDITNIMSATVCASRPSMARKPAARRCLFNDPVDHEQQKRDLQAISRKLDEQNNKRWDFDFANETPFSSGRFSWQRITRDEDIPEAYACRGFSFTQPKSCTLTENSNIASSRKRCADIEDDTAPAVKRSKPVISECNTSPVDIHKESTLQESSSENELFSPRTPKSTTTQTQITDYFSERKPRNVTTKGRPQL